MADEEEPVNFLSKMRQWEKAFLPFIVLGTVAVLIMAIDAIWRMLSEIQ